MKVKTDALISVGAALKAAEADGVNAKNIAGVTLDGAPVDAKDALAAFEKAEKQAPPSSSGLVTTVLDKIEARHQSIEEKLSTTNIGKRLVEILNKDPETVAREGRVEVKLKDGRSLEIPVVIVSRTLSSALQRVSMVTSAFALIPIVGQFVVAGTALASGIAAVVATVAGNAELAKSFGGMAAKHGTLLAVGFIPVVAGLASATSLLIDREDLKDLKKPVSVEQVVNLGS